jgi:hypothetical protein
MSVPLRINPISNSFASRSSANRGVVHLAGKPEIRWVTAGLLDEFAADDQHAA